MNMFGDVKREDALQCVGHGWSGLVNRAYDWLAENKPDIRVVQVKEKFGGLRIYVSEAGARFALDELETESFTVCEDCGKPGSLATIGHCWLVTVCDTCMTKRDGTRKNESATYQEPDPASS